MAYKLTKGDQSHYDIEITFTDADKVHEKGHVLQHYQADMEIHGFRKGHAPMDIVEKNINPVHLENAIIEHIAHHTLQDILKENADIKFLGEPYGFDHSSKDDNHVLTLRLDVYPEVEIKDASRQKTQMAKIETKVEDAEIESALLNLRQNYAEYQDSETIELDTVSKIALEWLDKSGEVLDKGTTYLGKTEFQANKRREKTFISHKKDDAISEKYDAKSLPEVLHAKEGLAPATIRFTIKDIKKQILPDFTPSNIEKFFGKDTEFKTEEALKDYIRKTLLEQKEQTELVKVVENYISTLRKDSFSVIIPQTMISQEFHSRLSSLQQRLGSEEKVKEYLEKMTEDQRKKFVDDIHDAAKESIEKFFILNKVAELLDIKLDRESQPQDLAIERTLYEHFNPAK
ncbi:trigger factor [candidate division SR1 bacterium]|nr:trigger factor [candidate division SR1 bacterium]